MQALLIAEAELGDRSHASRIPDVGWLVTLGSGALAVTDESLTVVARFVRESRWRGAHWVTPDLECAVTSERDRVAMIDRRGAVVWQTVHAPWGRGESESGSVWVSPDGQRVWATVPTESDADVWWVLDARRRLLLDGRPRLDRRPRPPGARAGAVAACRQRFPGQVRSSSTGSALTRRRRQAVASGTRRGVSGDARTAAGMPARSRS